MPIYEYKCLQCSARLELLQRANEASLKVCPKCGGALKKVISAPALQFKGRGWYITDYAKKTKVEKEGKAEEKPKKEKKDIGKPKKGQGSTKPD